MNLKPITGNRVAYTLDSTLDSVNRAEQTAKDMARMAGFSNDDTDKILISVREAVINAVLHGNAYDPDKKISLAYVVSPGAITVTITDEGNGLHEEMIPNPLENENLTKPSGRGIFMMRSFMDEVHVRDLHPGTEITLIKHASGPETDAKEH